MFNLLNNFSHSIDLDKRIAFPVPFAGTLTRDSMAFGIENGDKFHHQGTAFFFNFQEWKDRFTKKNGVISRTNPFPNWVFILLNNGYRSFQSFFNMLNQVRHNIEAGDSGCKSLSSRIEVGRGVFVAAKITIAVQKTCKPFKEFFRWLNFCRYSKRFNSARRGLFTSCNLGHKVLSRISLLFPGLVYIRLQEKQLGFFDKRMGLNLFDEKRNIWRGTSPFKYLFSVFSISVSDRSTKEGLKNLGDFFIANLDGYNLATLERKRNMSFSIEKASQITHRDSPIVSKLHFNNISNSPATTKCDDLRINSSGCHSLTTRRKLVRRGRRAFSAILLIFSIWSVGVEAESNRMPNNTSALPSEWGSVYNLRILTSSEAPVARGASANGQDVYYNTVLGKQALTHISQDEFSMKLIYRDPYYSGMLAQNATLAVKFAQSQAITQDTAIRNVLCTRLSPIGGP